MTSLMSPAPSGSAEQDWRHAPCCAEALGKVEAAFHAFVRGGAQPDAITTVRQLGHGHSAHDFLDVVALDHGHHEVAAFAEFLTRAVREREVGPARLLAGLAHLAEGDATAAERCLEEALRADPGLAPAASELSVLALDRGDLDRTATLLAHACCPPIDARWLDRQRCLVGGRGSKLGRNEPCPCGSGRKSKQCCDGHLAPSLKARSALVMQRLALYAARHDAGPRMLALAAGLIEGDIDDLEGRSDDAFLLDLAVFEGGLADAYLAERGPLLPDDERDLLSRAIAEPRRLWKLLEVDQGTGMRLQLSDGSGSRAEAIWLDERSGSRGRRAGEQILARVLSCEHAWVALGVPMIVAPTHRPRTTVLLRSSPDAIDYAVWYATLLAPPAPRNREGEPLVLCRAELAPASPADVAGALDDLLVGEALRPRRPSGHPRCRVLRCSTWIVSGFENCVSTPAATSRVSPAARPSRSPIAADPWPGSSRWPPTRGPTWCSAGRSYPPRM